MDDPDDIEVPLTKNKPKRNYEKTPAREAAIQKMMEARQKNIDIKNAQKTLKANEILAKHKVELKTDQPAIVKKAPAIKKIITEEEEDSEPEIIVVRRKKPKKQQIIIEDDGSDDDDEPVVVKKKAHQKSAVSETPAKKSSILNINNNAPPPPPKAVEQPKIDYKSFFG